MPIFFFRFGSKSRWTQKQGDVAGAGEPRNRVPNPHHDCVGKRDWRGANRLADGAQRGWLDQRRPRRRNLHAEQGLCRGQVEQQPRPAS